MSSRERKRLERAYLAKLRERLSSIKLHVFVRREDQVLVVRPLTVYHVNEVVVDFLEPIYAVRKVRVESLVRALAGKYRLSEFRVLQLFHQVLDDVSALVSQRPCDVKYFRAQPLQTTKVLWPTMAEISLTERCNNACQFCYLGCPDDNFVPRPPLAVEQFEAVIDKLWRQAKVPSLNFTGGEPTLSPALPELVQHAADLGFKVVVITNGRRLADESYLRDLIDAGVNGFQVSIEAADAGLHDSLVGVEGAFEQTVEGIRNCAALQRVDPTPEFWVSTNTTLTRLNRERVHELPPFVKDLGAKSMSMNVIIWTGSATKKRSELGVYYSELGPTVRRVKRVADGAGIKFSWLSPTPYCLFNPVMEGFGYKGCSCYGGLVSVAPNGDLIPCSSAPPHWPAAGNLLEDDFWSAWNSPVAQRHRAHAFAPTACKRRCDDFDICGGACPIYWEFLGTGELEREMELVGGTFKN
ncbi:MAG: hypothetical protein Kow0069_22440 [Promethearchaeota archaeon]